MNKYSKVDKKQIEQLKNQYSKLIKKNKFKTQLILGTTITSLLFAIANIQKILILNAGISSIFVVPAEVLLSMITVGFEINYLNKVYTKKEDEFLKKINDLEKETSKVNDNQIKNSKKVELENSYLNNNSIKTDDLENKDISLDASDTFEDDIHKKEKPKVLVKRY